jgi:hypothetical protein
MSESNEKPRQLPVGTRVRFIKELGADATGDHPALLYAEVGERGVVTGHDCKEGHWVRADNTASAFGAELGIEFVEDQP